MQPVIIILRPLIDHLPGYIRQYISMKLMSISLKRYLEMPASVPVSSAMIYARLHLMISNLFHLHRKLALLLYIILIVSVIMMQF